MKEHSGYDIENLVQKSAESTLENLAQKDPMKFMALWDKVENPHVVLDEETKKYFQQAGFLGADGNVHESTKNAVRAIRLRSVRK